MPQITYPLMPLLPRHFSDAAWYSTQLDADRASALVDFDRLRHYQRIFVAHLDGLRFGGEASTQIAVEQLQRWKGRGELFVCWHIAHELQHQDLASAAWNFLAAHPQPHFIDAAAWALLWLSAEKAGPVLEQLMSSTAKNADDPLAIQVALNAYGLRREVPTQDIVPLFRHESPGVRGEICRFAGRLRRFEALALLRQALTDEDPNVREQAAVALLLCNEAQAALPELYAAILRYAALVEAGEGAAAIRAEQRAQHLARLFGHAIPFPCDIPTMQTLALKLPLYLFLLTLAHHGNPAHIDLLLPFMRDTNNPEQPLALYKRRALWSMGFILGMNPESEELLTETPSLSVDWPRAPGLDQDTGLPEPDPEAVEHWWHVHKNTYASARVPYLMGKEMQDREAITSLLATGAQAQRFAASLHAIRTNTKNIWMDTRAPLPQQRKNMS